MPKRLLAEILWNAAQTTPLEGRVVLDLCAGFQSLREVALARVASGGLLLVKVGPETGGGDALGLTRKSARIEFFLWSLLLNKSARAKPLAAIWAR